MGAADVDMIVSGGGSQNAILLSMLRELLAPHKCRIASSDEFGMPSQAKEAVAFALLAWQTWHHRAGNVPAATGAGKPALLGQISYV